MKKKNLPEAQDASASRASCIVVGCYGGNVGSGGGHHHTCSPVNKC